MADIYLMRNDQQSGPYTLDALAEMHRGGFVHRDDHAWAPGMVAWQTVGDLLGVPPPLHHHLAATLPERRTRARTGWLNVLGWIFGVLAFKLTIGILLGVAMSTGRAGATLPSKGDGPVFLFFIAIGFGCFVISVVCFEVRKKRLKRNGEYQG